MDLSTGGDIRKIRRRILAATPLPLGTVPIYQAAIKAIEKRGTIVDMTEDDLFEAIETQAREGVDFMTVHCRPDLEGHRPTEAAGPGGRRRLPRRGLPSGLDASQRKGEPSL